MSGDMLRIKNSCTLEAIDAAYSPLIQAAIAAYHAVFPQEIEEIRLMGSVARGEAIPEVSDIDFLALVREEPSEDAQAALQYRAAALGRTFPIVSLVDLGISCRDNLHPTQHFILTSDSLAVAGIDRLTLREQLVTRDELIRLVTPSMSQLLPEYRVAVAQLAPDDVERLRFYSRIIGKDLLKCLRGIILRCGATYERNISAIAAQALAHFPEHAATITLLHRCYLAPTNDQTVLLEALTRATDLPS